MFAIGDYVTRNSYGNDIVFEIVKIDNGICILKGVCIRLYADSDINDLRKYNDKIDDDFNAVIDNYKTMDRNEYFYLPGKILHIDGDKDYLEKCMNFYKKNKIKAYGVFSKEDELEDNIKGFLEKYSPDILVITGHDALYRKRRSSGDYKNTYNFVKAVREARKFEKSHEKLLIIAGACQSNYEELIKAGANFASSPKRINIHALDPAVIATSLAFSDKNNNIDLINILGKTKYGADGMGGIITKGTMYVGYPREQEVIYIIDKIRNTIKDNIGNYVNIVHNDGRNKIFEYNAKIIEYYPNVFIIMLDDNSRMCFRYSDILTRTIEIKFNNQEIQ